MNDIKAPLAGKISGGDVLVKALKNKGIERIYSLCGGFLNPILIACQEHGIEVVTTRNEMEVSFMAMLQRGQRAGYLFVYRTKWFHKLYFCGCGCNFAGDPVIFIGVSSNMKNFNNNGLKELPQWTLLNQ